MRSGGAAWPGRRTEGVALRHRVSEDTARRCSRGRIAGETFPRDPLGRLQLERRRLERRVVAVRTGDEQQDGVLDRALDGGAELGGLEAVLQGAGDRDGVVVAVEDAGVDVGGASD